MRAMSISPESRAETHSLVFSDGDLQLGQVLLDQGQDSRQEIGSDGRQDAKPYLPRERLSLFTDDFLDLRHL